MTTTDEVAVVLGVAAVLRSLWSDLEVVALTIHAREQLVLYEYYRYRIP